jgi:hypothetical protein
MRPFLRIVLYSAVIVATGFARAWERIRVVFLSKDEVATRASGRIETLKRIEMETERLDRLRNPRDYQGR